MAIAVEGSEWFNLGPGASPSAVSLTVPSATNCIVAFYGGWKSTGPTLSDVTLGSGSTQPDSEGTYATGGDYNSLGYSIWKNPPTGSQDLAYTFSGSVNDGWLCGVIYLSGVDTTAGLLDVDEAESSNATDAITATVSTTSGDFVLKLDVHYTSSGTTSQPSPWTAIGSNYDGGDNQIFIWSAYTTASGSSTSVPNCGDPTDGEYPSVIGLVFQEASGSTQSLSYSTDLAITLVTTASSITRARNFATTLAITQAIAAAIARAPELGTLLAINLGIDGTVTTSTPGSQSLSYTGDLAINSALAATIARVLTMQTDLPLNVGLDSAVNRAVRIAGDLGLTFVLDAAIARGKISSGDLALVAAVSSAVQRGVLVTGDQAITSAINAAIQRGKITPTDLAITIVTTSSAYGQSVGGGGSSTAYRRRLLGFLRSL